MKMEIEKMDEKIKINSEYPLTGKDIFEFVDVEKTSEEVREKGKILLREMLDSPYFEELRGNFGNFGKDEKILEL